MWLLTDFQTLQEGWRDSTPQQGRGPARKWSSSRVPWEHSLVLKFIWEKGLFEFRWKMYNHSLMTIFSSNKSQHLVSSPSIQTVLGTRNYNVCGFSSHCDQYATVVEGIQGQWKYFSVLLFTGNYKW